jgi:hypothetical protein
MYINKLTKKYTYFEDILLDENVLEEIALQTIWIGRSMPEIQ